jgi:hypothetical protein
VSAKPVAVTIFAWLRDNLGARALAPLTSTDAYALRAAVQVVELYAYTREPSLLGAFRACVEQMQPGTRYFAFHAVAHVMDWSDRWTIWRAAGLEIPARIPCCKFGPQPRPQVQEVGA